MRQLSGKELKEFLAYKGNKVVQAHSFTEKIYHWIYCKHCGLLNLKNEPTRKAMRSPCITYE